MLSTAISAEVKDKVCSINWNSGSKIFHWSPWNNMNIRNSLWNLQVSDNKFHCIVTEVFLYIHCFHFNKLLVFSIQYDQWIKFQKFRNISIPDFLIDRDNSLSKTQKCTKNFAKQANENVRNPPVWIKTETTKNNGYFRTFFKIPV